MKHKSSKYETSWWSIELPEGWSVEDDPECSTFTSAKLKGALQLSAYRKDSDIGTNEICELADKQPEPNAVEIGVFVGLCNTFETDGVRWKKWWLVRDRTLIFATYNGPVANADVEILDAEDLLNTLQVRP